MRYLIEKNVHPSSIFFDNFLLDQMDSLERFFGAQRSTFLVLVIKR